jgi:hypothetical protein
MASANLSCDTTLFKIVDKGLVCDNSGLIPGNSGEVICPENSVCEKKVCFKSNDSIGNEEEVKTSNFFRIDKQPPLTIDNVSVDRNAFLSDQSVKLTCNDFNGSGCSKIRYCVGSSTCTPDTLAFPSANSININVSCPNGSLCNLHIRYQSEDFAGNLESIKTTPVIRIIKLEQGILNKLKALSLIPKSFEDLIENYGLAERKNGYNCSYTCPINTPKCRAVVYSLAIVVKEAEFNSSENFSFVMADGTGSIYNTCYFYTRRN